MRNIHKNLIGKPQGKRTLGKPTSREQHGIKMDLRETGCGLDSYGSG
jgi:hypothetical protein